MIKYLITTSVVFGLINIGLWLDVSCDIGMFDAVFYWFVSTFSINTSLISEISELTLFLLW